MRDTFSYARKRSLVCVSLKRINFCMCFPPLKHNEALPIYGRSQSCPVLRGHGVGSKLYSPHAPTSQYVVRMAQGTNSLKLLLITYYYYYYYYYYY